MNTLITVESRTVTQEDVYGTQSPTWAEFVQIWAEVQDVLPSRSESLDDSISITRRPARVRVDYMEGLGITSDMRIVVPGENGLPDRTMRIVAGPAEKGIRAQWEFVVEEVSTVGDEP